MWNHRVCLLIATSLQSDKHIYPAFIGTVLTDLECCLSYFSLKVLNTDILQLCCISIIFEYSSHCLPIEIRQWLGTRPVTLQLVLGYLWRLYKKRIHLHFTVHSVGADKSCHTLHTAALIVVLPFSNSSP
jgi:hypothetical protein